MIAALVTRFAATLEIKRRRLVATVVAGFVLLLALIFALAAGWLWLAGEFGAITANLICAGGLAVLAGLILLVGRPRKPAPVVPATPVANSSSLAAELIAAFAAGSQLGRSMRR